MPYDPLITKQQAEALASLPTLAAAIAATPAPVFTPQGWLRADPVQTQSGWLCHAAPTAGSLAPRSAVFTAAGWQVREPTQDGK